MPFQPHAKGVIVRIRLTPGARKTGFNGTMPVADGAVALKVGVSAPPEDGKANRELLKMLAKEWRLPKTSLAIISGETNRHKAVLIETAEGPALLARLRDWLAVRDD